MTPLSLARATLVLFLLGCSRGGSAATARAADAVTARPAAATATADAPAAAMPAAPQGGAAARPATPPAADSALIKADEGRIIGSAKASVWMIMISDFQCPYCKRWHDESWAAIKKDYVDTGKLRVAYINLPLSMHRNAWPAAQVAMCASVQGKFWPVQDGLFRTQKDWERIDNPTPMFEAVAQEAGSNMEALRACVKKDAVRTLIQSDVDRATNAGASSTPTFFIGGRAMLGAQPLSAFREAIDAALAAQPAGK